jgi:hypothetical protein
MSATPATFTDRLYNNFINTSVSYNLYEKTTNKNTGIFAITPTRSRNCVILSSIAAKAALIPICALSVIEIIAKTALGLISYMFSLLTFFIPSISGKAHNLAVASLDSLGLNFYVIPSSIFSILFN